MPAQTQRIYNRTCKVTKGGKREKMYQNWIQIQLRMLKLPENGIGNVKGSSLRRKQDREKQERGKKKKRKRKKNVLRITHIRTFLKVVHHSTTFLNL